MRKILLFIVILILPLFVFAADTIPVKSVPVKSVPIKSVVVFNTVCAKCHEGECSGRMSFHLPEAAANQHIRRHGGDLSLDRIKPLFKLLRYMKEKCGFYPLPYALINDQIWQRDILERFHSPSRQAYFVPLGFLKPGNYQLLLEVPENTQFCVEIINEEFDFMDKDDLSGKEADKKLQFYVDEAQQYFLRLTAQKSIILEKLSIFSIIDSPESELEK